MRYLIPSLTFTIALLAGMPAVTSAQTLDDALRFSEGGSLGTARSLGTANSMSAIGAEWTALQSNPAGLAAFRGTELSFTVAGLQTGTSESEIDGTPSSSDLDGNFRLALPQIAAVFAREPIGSRWTQFNFGIGVSQTRRHEETIAFDAATPGSISDFFLDDANRYPLDGGLRIIDDNGFARVDNPLTLAELSSFGSGLAYDVILIDGDDGSEAPGFYTSAYNFNAREIDGEPGTPLRKVGNVRRRGYNASVDLSFAANYDETFLFGGTLGIVNSSFEENNDYVERDDADDIAVFNDLQFLQNTRTSGTGILGRFGVIYRASQAIRLGLAYHTPTVTFAEESYSTQLTYRFTEDGNFNDNSAASPEAAETDFRYRTPSQFRVSAAAILGKRGFLSAELGYIDYSAGKFTIDDEFDGDGSRAAELNEAIENSLRPNIQFRVGGEANLSPVQVRAGFEYLGTPLEDVTVNGENVSEDPTFGITAGLGYRSGRLGLDLGYRYTIAPDRVYRPYTIPALDFPQPFVNYSPTLNTFALTVGYKLGRR